MSEFKFLCPVCGQHIATDSSAGGTQIECPTCFQKIVVPQPPKSDSKYILSATQYIKPPAAPAPTPVSRPTPPARRYGPVIFALLALAGLAAAWFYLVPHPASPSPAPPGAGPDSSPSGSARSPWTLNLAGAAFPDSPAGGKVHSRDFNCDRATLQNGSLMLRQEEPVEITVVVHLSAPDPRELGGTSIEAGTNAAEAVPQISLRWREGSLLVMQKFTNGYAMKLDFRPAAGNSMPGRIVLCLPDRERSYVAGTFDAEIKKPSRAPRHP